MAVATVPIVNFLDYLSQNPDPYNDCDVISVTHAKNLDSRVKHEYLHLIIRHRTTNRWRRLLAERQNTQDQVIIGFWPWVDQGGSASSSGPVALGDLEVPNPLLMRNLRFEPLNLQSVAKVLLEVHRQKPDYNFFFANCYWYSDAVFQIFKGMARGTQYTKWSWLSFKGIPLILAFDALQAALDFKNEMRGVLEGAAQADGAEKEDEDAGSKGAPEAHKAAGDAANSDVSVFEENALSDEIHVSESTKLAMEQVSVTPKLDEPEILRVTKERKEEIGAFSTLVLADPQKEANLAFFESCLSSSKEAEVGQDTHPDPFVDQLAARVVEISSAEAPSKEEEACYEEAIRAFAGAVLRQVRQDGVAF